ncbi:ABC transporter C family member 10, partial [Mucuna pruriens]
MDCTMVLSISDGKLLIDNPFISLNKPFSDQFTTLFPFFLYRYQTILSYYDEPMSLMKKEGLLFKQLVKEYWSHFQSAESH